MNRLRNFLAVMTALSFAIASSVSIVIRDLVHQAFQESHGPLATILTIAAIALAFAVIQYAGTFLVNYSQSLRRFIAADEFVEGTWIEIVHDGEKMRYDIGITKIEYKSNELVFSGTTYSTSEPFIRIGAWYSITSHYQESCLYYLYKESAVGKFGPPVLGSGQVTFQTVSGPPEEYQASFFDPIHASTKIIGFGYKLVAAEDLKDAKTPEGRTRLFTEYIARHASAGRTPETRTPS